jgi:hypothetical protein
VGALAAGDPAGAARLVRAQVEGLVAAAAA